jgi:hypothetical protein
MIRNVLAWIILFILIAYICGLVSSAPLNNLAQTVVFAPLSVNQGDVAAQSLGSQFGQSFPPSATGFFRASQGDQALWIRVSVAPNEINRLFGGSAFFTCRFPLQPAYRPVFEYERLLTTEEQAATSWWTPNATSIRTFSGGECTGTDYRFFRMFVDQTSSSQWTLYMEVVRS